MLFEEWSAYTHIEVTYILHEIYALKGILPTANIAL